MDQEYFYGSAVSHLTINDAYLEQFTTDSFLNVHQNATIQIMNSQIEGRSSKKGVIPLKIKSIDFINNKMLEIYRDTIFVEASEYVKFDGCDLKVNSEDLIRITANKVFIRNSNLRLNSKRKHIFQ